MWMRRGPDVWDASVLVVDVGVMVNAGVGEFVEWYVDWGGR